MTTEPGVLPEDYQELDFNRVSEELKGCIYAVQAEITKYENERLEDEDKRDAKAIEEELAKQMHAINMKSVEFETIQDKI